METPINYVRVSKEDKRRPGVSPEVQMQAAAATCKAHHLPPPQILEDRNVSAGVPLDRRPGGRRLAELLQLGPRPIVVMRLDRLFRRVDDGSYWLRRWAREGVQLVSVTEQIDITTPNGMLMAHIVLACAEYEHQLATVRTRAVRAQMKDEGKRLGGNDPYGFTHNAANDLVPIPAEQAIRSRILRLHSFGNGPEKIAAVLNRDGVQARGGKPWSKSSVRAVLRRAGRKKTPETIVPSMNPEGMPDHSENDGPAGKG